MPRFIVFLQNSWSPRYAGRRWPRKGWLKALEASRSGQRLRTLRNRFMMDAEWIIENTTPICGKTPDSVVPPDLIHMSTVIFAVQPDVIIACGKQAELALAKIEIPQEKSTRIIVPHPANRVLTNLLYERVGGGLDALYRCPWFRPAAKKIVFRQERGSVVIDPDPWLIAVRGGATSTAPAAARS